MSSAGPQHAGGNQGNGSQPSGRGLRSLPGFTTAAVVFVLIVLLGVGGIAIANWNQNATVAIAVTAGAAATTIPSPSPTPNPTPSATPIPSATATAPPAGAGNIVPISAPFSRPGKVVGGVVCSPTGSSGGFTFSWAGLSEASSYVVSLRSINAASIFSDTREIQSTSQVYELGNKDGSFGKYLFRIQAMKNGVAGDPLYWMLQYDDKWSRSCYESVTDGKPPLGAVTVSPVPGTTAAGSNILQLDFSASLATSYVVSIESATTGDGATKVKYGAEFTVTSRQATLSFPPRVTGPNGSDFGTDYYGAYKLRVMPMKVNPDKTVTAGDPVFKVVRYYANNFTIGDN